MEKLFVGRLGIEDIQPIISSNCIWFPVEIEVIDTDEYHGDARSFGYPVDEGYCTKIVFDYVVGALAEDTIDLYKNIKNFVKPQKVSINDFLETSEVRISEYTSELDHSWIDKAIAEDEDYESFDDIMFHAWPQEWQRAYYDFIHKMHRKATNNQPILTDSYEYTLYELDEKHYYAIILKNPTDWGRLKKDDDGLALLQAAIKTYEEQLERKNVLKRQFIDNLKILKNCL